MEVVTIWIIIDNILLNLLIIYKLFKKHTLDFGVDEDYVVREKRMVIPDFRNPMKNFKIQKYNYDDYVNRENGLLQAVEPDQE